LKLSDKILNIFGLERRGRIDDPNLWLTQPMGMMANSGVMVTPDLSLTQSTIFGCINILSETLASMPLIVYKRTGENTKERYIDHPNYHLLHSQPNEYQTAFQFMRLMMTMILMRGNAYAFKEFNERGVLTGLYPLNAKRMEVEKKDDGRIVYTYTDEKGKQFLLPSEYIWHITDFVTDGLKGISRITLAREGIGLALAAESYGGQFFGNSAVASSVIRHPSSLQPNARKNLKESLIEFQNTKRFTTMVLEEGMSFEKIGLSNNDAQFLETRSFQTKEIARWFNVPLILLQEGDKTSTYASAEQFFLSFVKHTMLPWCVNWEQSIQKNLFTPRERKKTFVEFIMEGLLRADTTARYNAYKIGREWGWLSANDVRRLENMNSIPNGDIYLQPMNMVESGMQLQKQITDEKEGEEYDGD